MIALYVDGRVNLDASLEDVETAIHSLDGSQCTLVVVELASGKTITIGGGPSKVVAELSENDTHRWCVVDPPARICIEKEAAWRQPGRSSLRTVLEAGIWNTRL